MSIITTRITVGIATYRRLHVADTLTSLARLALPLDTTLHIVVVDADEQPTAQTIVASVAAEFGLDVTYLHAPTENLATARNSCLAAATGDYFAFIDDDEIADPAWLSELLTRQRSTQAGIILGPVEALYFDGTPRWVRLGNFHSLRPNESAPKLTTGYANNVLMKLTPAIAALRFDANADNADADFFHRAHRAGVTILYCPTARLYAVVPPFRATLGWLIQRSTSDGQARAALIHRWRTVYLLRATLDMLGAFAMMLPCALSPLGRRRWLLRGMFYLALVRALQKSLRSPRSTP